MNAMSTTAENLKRLREAKGLSQDELAREIGVTPQTISRIERGVTIDPEPATMRALAKFFGVATIEGDAEGAGRPVHESDQRGGTPGSAIPEIVLAYLRVGLGRPVTTLEQRVLEGYATADPTIDLDHVHAILMTRRARLKQAVEANSSVPPDEPPPRPRRGDSGQRPVAEVGGVLEKAGGKKARGK
jgi:putative transcriptional regulator